MTDNIVQRSWTWHF